MFRGQPVGAGDFWVRFGRGAELPISRRTLARPNVLIGRASAPRPQSARRVGFKLEKTWLHFAARSLLTVFLRPSPIWSASSTYHFIHRAACLAAHQRPASAMAPRPVMGKSSSRRRCPMSLPSPKPAIRSLLSLTFLPSYQAVDALSFFLLFSQLFLLHYYQPL